MGVDAVMFFTTEQEISDKRLDLYQRQFKWCYPEYEIKFVRGSDYAAEGVTNVVEFSSYERFYGPGYERGPVLDMILKMEWIRRHIPGVTLYYGSDSSYEVTDAWQLSDTLELLEHYFTYGEGPYRHGKEHPMPTRELE